MKKILLIVFLLTLSCSNNKVVKNHGLSGLEAKNSKIVELKTNKNDILNILGRPSTVSLFDESSWFYIEREKTNQSIFKLGKSKIQKNNILQIDFNKYGIVKSKKIYNVENMNDLKIVKKVTQNKYDNTSKLGKLLKSLEQKINASSSKK